MFDVAPSELLLVAIVALVVIGPKDLPKAMRIFGQWVGRARAMARHFRSGIDTMMREAELEEMEKQWKVENERIMREFPTIDAPALPAADSPELPLDAPPPAAEGGGSKAMASPVPPEADRPPP
jgi:sec-independent protein translocase protein TatB